MLLFSVSDLSLVVVLVLGVLVLVCCVHLAGSLSILYTYTYLGLVYVCVLLCAIPECHPLCVGVRLGVVMYVYS
jgi:hypothetical protein